LLHIKGAHFTSGRSKFADRVPGSSELTAKVYVKVQFGEAEPILAQLDTGAAWSILDRESIQLLGSSLERLGSMRISTRFGTLRGYLAQAPITFPADDGQALTVTATFFVSEDWPLPLSFLGYSGLLDSIRFALDPQANHFYFGLPAESW
jgi:hypothetical protein